MSPLACRAVALLLCVATPALAGPRLLDERDLRAFQVADYHGAAPVGPVPAPTPVAPVVRTQVDFFLLGLGLTGAGLILGGAGFGVLYGCRAGTACHGDTTTVVGWVLAAPGVIPLAVGLIMIWLSSGSRGRVEAPSSAPASAWAFSFAPLPGGAMVGAGTQF